jgi:signal peptidase II
VSVAGDSKAAGAGQARSRPASALLTGWGACAVAAAVALAADVATKAWAAGGLAGGHVVTVPGGVLRLQLVVNHGASFGLAAGLEPLVAVLTVTGVALLASWAVRAGSVAERLGASLAAAGAAGNLIDRLARSPGVVHGGVIDWIHLSFYGPTFNLADVWLRGGVLLAVAGWLWRSRTARAGDGRPSGQAAGGASAGPGPARGGHVG